MKSKKMAELEDDFREFKAHTERRYGELKNLLLSLIQKQASLVKPPPREATKDLVVEEVLFSEDTTKMIDMEKIFKVLFMARNCSYLETLFTAGILVQELSPSLARRSEAESLTLMREAPTIVTERVTLFPSSLVRRAEHW
ncbi:hypothetical protein Tco_1126940 [Tanacetum coccineum]